MDPFAYPLASAGGGTILETDSSSGDTLGFNVGMILFLTGFDLISKIPLSGCTCGLSNYYI